MSRLPVALLLVALGLFSCISAAQADCVPFAPFLNFNNSGASNTGLRITVVSSSLYYSSSIYFDNGADSCRNDLGANAVSWWSAPSTSGCDTTLTMNGVINSVIRDCAFVRQEGLSSNVTYFKGLMIVTTVHNAGVIRGVQINTTIVTSMQVTIGFQSRMEVTSAPIQVFGWALVYAGIVNQSFDAVSHALVVTVVTSAQWPYVMYAPYMRPVTGYTASTVPMFPDASEPTQSICNATGTDMNSAQCTQLWVMTVTARVAYNTLDDNDTVACINDTNYSGTTWVVSFNLTCVDGYSGSCLTLDPLATNQTMVFSTVSLTACPTMSGGPIGSDQIPSASIAVYEDSSYTKQQNQFVFGTRSYFQVTVTSSIRMSDAHVERVTLQSGAPFGVSNLYLKSFVNASSFFNSSFSGNYLNDDSGARFDQGLTLMQVNDASNSLAYQLKVNFSWVWSAYVSSASGDNAMPATVFVALRVRYADVSNVTQSSKLHMLEIPLSQVIHSLSNTGSVTLSTLVGVKNGASTVTPAATDAASENFLGTGMSSSMFGVLVAAGGFVVLAVGATAMGIYRVKSRRYDERRNKQLQSINIGSSSSATSGETEIAHLTHN